MSVSGRAKNTLAINGGQKVRNTPWPKRHLFGEEEKLAVMALFDRAIASGDVFDYNGEEEEAYCREFAQFLGGGYADAVNSGTSAIYVALRALEIEPFTEVIVPPITDPGGVMPVPLINCIPVVADSAPGTLNAGPEQIEARITERTSAIIVAHIAGLPADMDPIMEIARKKGIPVIEDCAQAHGALYKGRFVGTIGDIGAFSTMSGKHHATGAQGGVVFTKNETLYWRARRYSDRGKPFGLQDWHTPTCNLVCSLNLNLNDLAACIGRVQLKKLPEILARRRKLAYSIKEACKPLKSVSLDTGLPDTEGAFWFLIFKLDLAKLAVDKDKFVAALAAEGLPVGGNYLHLFTKAPWYKNRAVFGKSGYPWTCPLYRGDPDKEYPLSNVFKAHDSIFTMAFHENLTSKEVLDIQTALRKVETEYLQSH
jgi:dTDP-4-amino-4,6-dideoxygalactose transaminase